MVCWKLILERSNFAERRSGFWDDSAKRQVGWANSPHRALHQYTVEKLGPASPVRLEISLRLAKFTRDTFKNQEAESVRILEQALSEIEGFSLPFIADLPDDKREAINSILSELESWGAPFQFHTSEKPRSSRSHRFFLAPWTVPDGHQNRNKPPEWKDG